MTSNHSSRGGSRPASRPARAAATAHPLRKIKGAGATGVREELEEIRSSGALLVGLRGLIHQAPSWLVSMVFHVAILLVLALWMVPQPGPQVAVGLMISENGESVRLDKPMDIDPEPPAPTIHVDTVDPPTSAATKQLAGPLPEDDPPPAWDVDFDPLGRLRRLRGTLLERPGIPGVSGLGGRDPRARGPLLRDATPASERAVVRALAWLAAHQMPDGGWSFNHATCPACRGQCRNPGELAEARVAATGLALLPFLGAGQTHQNGKYKKTVRAGLCFLVSRMSIDTRGGALNEPGGRMYAHGIASIALCEAYAMTHDKGLYRPAQEAVRFIGYAQDPVGGGWRYEPRQRGDTSVLGWQIMALKSAHLGYLQVPPLVIKRAFTFLDTVQSNSGANYGYVDPGAGQATTAIGLLCRMYLGWNRDNPALVRGVKWLSGQGPSKGNMYYNYYATQVMRHWEGDEWEKWNNVMRDQLVQAQAAEGHEAGSWFMSGGDHGSRKGGRLYCTAMATMILEVYYRTMPIYRPQSIEENFPE